MAENTNTLIDRFLILNQYADVKNMLKDIKEVYDVEIPEIIKRQLYEDSVLTSGDWARFGVIVGLLWNKLDSIITELKSGNMDRKELTRKLGDIADVTKNLRRG